MGILLSRTRPIIEGKLFRLRLLGLVADQRSSHITFINTPLLEMAYLMAHYATEVSHKGDPSPLCFSCNKTKVNAHRGATIVPWIAIIIEIHLQGRYPLPTLPVQIDG